MAALLVLGAPVFLAGLACYFVLRALQIAYFFLRALYPEARMLGFRLFREREEDAREEGEARAREEEEEEAAEEEELPQKEEASLSGALSSRAWILVGELLGARELCRLCCTCWYLRELFSRDLFWEALFAREKQAHPCWLVRGHSRAWKRMFRVARGAENVCEALRLSQEHGTIVVMPGVHDVGLLDGTLRVRKVVHFLGCSYNRRFRVDLDTMSEDAVPEQGAPEKDSVVIQSTTCGPIDWFVVGGSISNLTIAFPLRNGTYFFGLSVEPGARVVVSGCRVYSWRHSAVKVHERADPEFSECSFLGSPISHGVFVGAAAKPTFRDCIFGENGANGIECSGGEITMSRCLVYKNRFNGVSLTEGAQATLDRVNIFDNRANGVDVGAGCHLRMTRCKLRRNHRGLLQHVSEQEDSDALVASYLSTNDFEANRNDQVKAVRITADPVERATQEGVCTFAYTGPHYVVQEWFHCSCGFVRNRGLCRPCADYHASLGPGHRVFRNRKSGFYCDDALTGFCAEICKEKLGLKE